jgi:transcriptional regulator with GAF, ATPase, and Fis domain
MSVPASKPPAIDLVQDLQELARLAPSEGALDDLLRRGLDWLERVAAYDLATIFVLEGPRLVVRAARGRLAPRVKGHSLLLERYPTLREAMETRRARVYREEDHRHGDGDPFDEVLGLPPGHSCLVAPLYAGDETYGVLTLDRAVCETYAPAVVSLVEVYAQLLAIAIQAAGHKAALERLHRQDHAHAKLLEEELGGDPLGLEASNSVPMQRVLALAHEVARGASPVLIRGETGTGKERLARALHRWSPRAEHPFVTLHCTAVPAAALEAELLGHATTERERPGRLLLANGGTLLLDGVEELPLGLQGKLLRVLEAGAFEPLGSERTTRVDVRLLATTAVDLDEAVAAGRFRADLYFRLAAFPLELPPLRERREDLGLLCQTLLAEFGRRTGRHGRAVTEEGLERLRGYGWPGNVRELANILERAAILSPDAALGPQMLDIPGRRRRGSTAPAGSESSTLAEVQRLHIERTLAQTRGRIYGRGGAAALLGLKPSTLQSKMAKLGLERPG